MSRRPLFIKLIYLIGFLFLATGLGYTGGLGCDNTGSGSSVPTPTPTSTPSPSASPTPTPTADLVMGDTVSDRVYIFYDVLHLSPGTTQAPDVNLSSNIDEPITVIIVDNILLVANGVNSGVNSNKVLIFDDFLNLDNNSTPTVILNNAISQLDNVGGMAVAPGLIGHDLYVSNRDDNTVTIYRNLESIVAGGVPVAPDAILNSGTSDLVDPTSPTVANNILYVCNENTNEILIFNNAESIVNAVTPDVLLNEIGSGIFNCDKIRVFDNVLYVTNISDNKIVTAFSPADALTNLQDPDFSLIHGTASDSNPQDIFVDKRLFISNSATPKGVEGFNSPFKNKFPDVSLTDPISGCRGLDGVFGSLFIACGGSTGLTAVYGYLDSNGIITDDPPDLTLHDPTMLQPDSLDVEVR